MTEPDFEMLFPQYDAEGRMKLIAWDDETREEWQKARTYIFYAATGHGYPDFGGVLARLRHVSTTIEDGTYDPMAHIKPFMTPDVLAETHPVRNYCDRRAIWKTQVWIDDDRPTLHDLLERRFGKGYGSKGIIAAATPIVNQEEIEVPF